jgi:hypothetical protein
MINATRLRRVEMPRWRRRLIQRTIYVVIFPYKLRIGVLSEWAHAKSKKPQKVAGIMMPFFAPQSFVLWIMWCITFIFPMATPIYTTDAKAQKKNANSQ